jgi:hypothetical protein
MANQSPAYAVPGPGSSANVYGVPTENVPQDMQDYADPGPGAPYLRAFGWAPGLSRSPSTTETPSAQRLATVPRYDFYSDGASEPEVFYDKRDADKAHRESITDTRATPWDKTTDPGYEDPGTSVQARWAPNPRSTPPPEPRITNRLSPGSYSFVRPFDQFNRQYDSDPPTGSARHLNGTHFSMADHRRNYDILGMTPPMIRRNTFRIEPSPWDTDIVDLPPQQDARIVNSRVQSVEVPPAGSSYRLM